jgi:hypothetical protein
MWRKLFKIFGAKVVILYHHDGDIHLRFAKSIGDGRYICTVICDKAILFPDGTVTKSYINKWEEI